MDWTAVRRVRAREGSFLQLPCLPGCRSGGGWVCRARTPGGGSTEAPAPDPGLALTTFSV